MSAAEKITAAIQALLDEYGDGWNLGQFVLALALERVTPDGRLESTVWTWAPTEQADWMSSGLLEEARDLQAYAVQDDD